MKIKTVAMLSMAMLGVSLAISPVQARSLADVQASGVLRVGTTGDYKPMS